MAAKEGVKLLLYVRIYIKFILKGSRQLEEPKQQVEERNQNNITLG